MAEAVLKEKIRKPRGRGRPTLLSPEREKILLQAVEMGLTRAACASAAGCHVSSLQNWIKRGEQEKEGLYRDFFNRLYQAQQIGIQRDIELIDKVSEGVEVVETTELLDFNGCIIRTKVSRKKLPGNWLAKKFKLEMLKRFWPEQVTYRPAVPLPDNNKDEIIQVNYLEDRDP
jgi:hypothetical protein